MPFKKYRLLKYEMEKFQALNSDGWGYVLTIEVWTWWGLFKKIVKQPVQLPYHKDAGQVWSNKINVWINH